MTHFAAALFANRCYWKLFSFYIISSTVFILLSTPQALRRKTFLSPFNNLATYPPPPHQHTPTPLPRLFPMPSQWPRKPNMPRLVCPQIHSVAFPPCQLSSSHPAKWNVKPHLWRALSPVMQGKQKAKWLFHCMGVFQHPQILPFLPLFLCVLPGKPPRCNTCMRECRTAGVLRACRSFDFQT